MDEIDESYKSISTLEEKLKRVRDENSNFCQVKIKFYLTSRFKPVKLLFKNLTLCHILLMKLGKYIYLSKINN